MVQSYAVVQCDVGLAQRLVVSVVRCDTSRPAKSKMTQTPDLTTEVLRLVNELTVSVLTDQPRNLAEHCAGLLEAKLKQRNGSK